MIGEFSCSSDESGQSYDKRAWIEDTFAKLMAAYSNIKLFVWFNFAKTEDLGAGTKLYDWRYNSTTDCATTFASSLKGSYYKSTIR
jgi:hypothetical protein